MVAIFRNVWDAIVIAWYQLVDAFKAVWDGIVAVWYVIVDYFKLIWDGIIGIFRNVVDAFGGFLENLVTGLSGIGQFIIDGLVAAIAGAGNIFSGIGTMIWDGLKSGLDGLGTIFTTIFDAINPASLFGKIFRIDPKETEKGEGGTIENTLGINLPFVQFAKGGMVGGNALLKGDSSLNDRILALLSPGEAIIPRSLMQDKATRAIVEAVLSGKINPNKYAGGSWKVGGTKISISAKGIQVNDKPLGESIPKSIADVVNPLGDLWNRVEKEFYGIVMKMFESNKLHGGGLVGFANGGDVPAMLQSGEFVINKKSAGTLGGDLLNRLNSGKIGETTQNMTFNIDIKTTEPIDDAFFRNRLMPKIKDEFKRASLDGQFVISKRGIGT
jgi:hypothetical protein